MHDTPTPAEADARPRRAVVTGASRGLGRAVATGLAHDGWEVVVDARSADDLASVADELADHTRVAMVIGDVTDPDHRHALAEAAASLGPIDLLVNNAGALGPSPLPRLADLDAEDFADLLDVNTVAPLAVFRALVPHLAPNATVLNLTSDAAVGAWEGWGAYGATKAALDQVSAVLAVEHPELTIHAVDPGDMRTDMHQAAFPGEDIGDRPGPDAVVPHLLALVVADLDSGRHRARDIDPRVVATTRDVAK